MAVHCSLLLRASEMGNVSSAGTDDEPVQETLGLVSYAVIFHSLFIYFVQSMFAMTRSTEFSDVAVHWVF